MRQYSSDLVELSWSGLDLAEGLATGTFVQEAINTPKFNQKPTGRGKIVRIYNPDKSGTVTITVDQESQVHQQLKALSAEDDLSRNIVAPMVMFDGSTKEAITYTNAYISVDPDESRGTESATFAWVFNFERRQAIPNPTNQNAVGD